MIALNINVTGMIALNINVTGMIALNLKNGHEIREGRIQIQHRQEDKQGTVS